MAAAMSEQRKGKKRERIPPDYIDVYGEIEQTDDDDNNNECDGECCQDVGNVVKKLEKNMTI